VCTYASLAVAACADAVESLEVQLGESDLLHEVVGGARPVLVDGCYEVPAGPGVGVALDDRVLAAHPYRPVPPFLDERLG
jgi:L-alanine-DL-glutamate epimerase-like enolase superfamily enzyme